MTALAGLAGAVPVEDAAAAPACACPDGGIFVLALPAIECAFPNGACTWNEVCCFPCLSMPSIAHSREYPVIAWNSPEQGARQLSRADLPANCLPTSGQVRRRGRPHQQARTIHLRVQRTRAAARSLYLGRSKSVAHFLVTLLTGYIGCRLAVWWMRSARNLALRTFPRRASATDTVFNGSGAHTRHHNDAVARGLPTSSHNFSRHIHNNLART